MSLIDYRELAVLEEGRQALGISEVALEARPIAGGLMCRGEPGTWANTAVGIGLKGAVDPGEIDELVRWYEGAGIEPRVELAPFADATAVEALSARGFVVRVFENTFFRVVGGDVAVRPVVEPPAGLEIRVVDRADDARVREYAEVCVQGFATPGAAPRAEDMALAERCARHGRSIAITAHLDGRCVCAGTLEILGTLSALYALSVVPEYRHRGIQQAMIAYRLNLAAAKGATLATISSRPGVATERNVRRMGFQLAYTKVVLVRPGAGLAPVAI